MLEHCTNKQVNIIHSFVRNLLPNIKHRKIKNINLSKKMYRNKYLKPLLVIVIQPI